MRIEQAEALIAIAYCKYLNFHALVQWSSVVRDGEARSKSLGRCITAKLGESMRGKTGGSIKAVCSSLARFLRFRGSSRISARVQLNAIFGWHRYARRSCRVSRRGIAGKRYANITKRTREAKWFGGRAFYSIHQNVISSFFYKEFMSI